MPESRPLAIQVNVFTEDRMGHWAAWVEHCPVVVYADSQAAAQERALDTLVKLLKHKEDPKAYLASKGIPHWLESESMRRVTVPLGG